MKNNKNIFMNPKKKKCNKNTKINKKTEISHKNKLYPATKHKTETFYSNNHGKYNFLFMSGSYNKRQALYSFSVSYMYILWNIYIKK